VVTVVGHDSPNFGLQDWKVRGRWPRRYGL